MEGLKVMFGTSTPDGCFTGLKDVHYDDVDFDSHVEFDNGVHMMECRHPENRLKEETYYLEYKIIG